MTIGGGQSPNSPIAPALLEVLSDARARGFIGPGPLMPHVAHALRFSRALGQVRGTELHPGDRVVDLGAGGGLPGLVLAMSCAGLRMTLVEGSTRRGAFLQGAVRHCELEERVDVAVERAEVLGSDPQFRGHHTVVVSRSFGSPGETAECASPLLSVE